MASYSISCRPILVDDSYVEVFVDLTKELKKQNVASFEYSLYFVKNGKSIYNADPRGVIRFVTKAGSGLIVAIEPTAYMELYVLAINVVGDGGKKASVQLCISSSERLDQMVKECE